MVPIFTTKKIHFFGVKSKGLTVWKDHKFKKQRQSGTHFYSKIEYILNPDLLLITQLYFIGYHNNLVRTTTYPLTTTLIFSVFISFISGGAQNLYPTWNNDTFYGNFREIYILFYFRFVRYCYENGNGILQMISKSSKNKNNGLLHTINE